MRRSVVAPATVLAFVPATLVAWDFIKPMRAVPNGLGWLGGLHLFRDWTDGCIAVTDAEIEEIWALVDAGTPMRIMP